MIRAALFPMINTQKKLNDKKSRLPKAANILGVVLCGGKSKRMGTPKETLSIHRFTFLELAVMRMRLVCAQVVVSKKTMKLNEPFPVIEDLPGYAGPVAGIITTLEKYNGEGVLVAPVDSPFISAAFLSYILKHRNGCDVVIPSFSGTFYPTVGYYRKNCLSVLKEESSAKTMNLTSLLKDSPLRVRLLDTDDMERSGNPEKMLFNVNTPADYTRAIEWA